MKHKIRVLSLLLIFCMGVTSLTSCFTVSEWILTESDTEPSSETVSDTEKESTTEQSDKKETVDADITYTLTEEYMTEFYELLAQSEALTLVGTDTDAIEAAWEELEAMYYHIVTQMQISYILFCMDGEDESTSEQYLEATEMQSEAYGEYMLTCRRIDASESPYREEFFSDWSDAEIEELRQYSPEVTEMEQANNQFLVEYRALDLYEQEEEMLRLYRDYVENQNLIATTLGFENYYEYATHSVFDRGYTKEEREQFRQYVKEYLVPLCESTYEILVEKINALHLLQYSVVNKFMVNSYDDLTKDYMDLYLDSFDEETGEIMREMLEARSVFTSAYNAHDGAFTVYLYEADSAFCYFGPSYQDIMTVAHEMGHFYAAQTNLDSTNLLDLAETHSQANEWLMMAFLKGEISQTIYETILYYQFYDTLATVIVSTIVDEFEEAVYTGEVDMTDPDAAMDRICDGYGGKDFLHSYILEDINLYWKYVVVESSVYYLSYATSGVAALSLYAVAAADYEEGQEIYCRLVEEADPSNVYVQILSEAGLASPFEEDVYLALQTVFGES